MKKTLLPLLFLFTFFAANAQLTAVIKDSLTKQSVPYVNIWVLGENTGTTADENGNFSFENSAENKKIVLSCVGYERKEIAFNAASKTIYLKRADNLLTEVLVTPRLRDKTLVVGKLSKKDGRFRFGNTGTPWIIGRYFPFKQEYEKTAYVQKIRCVTSSKIPDSKFGVRIYSIDKDGKPIASLHNTIIVGIARKGEQYTEIDVAGLNIKFPENGIVIGLEWIITSENQYETFYNKADGGKKQIRYTPNFGTSILLKGEQSYTYVSGNWRSDKEIKSKDSPMNGRSISIELILSN